MSAAASRLDAPPSILVPAGAEAGAVCLLDDEDLAHLKVLRLAPSAPLRAVDGAGRSFAARLIQLDRHAGAVRLDSETTPDAVARPSIWLLQGVLHSARMDWLVEKATELGVAGLVAVQTARAQGGKGDGRAARWERLMRAAFLQSLGLWRPQLLFAQDMHEAAQLSGVQTLVLAEPDGEPWDTLRLPDASAGVIVGPEGGLTPEERDSLGALGVLRAQLGPTRLRAETAALTLTAAVSWRLAAAAYAAPHPQVPRIP